MEQPISGRVYTVKDYWSLPDNERAELIDGQFYDMAPPTREHQKILSELLFAIQNYIRNKGIRHSNCR